MPALLTSTSITLKRDTAVSTILAAVAGSPMSPSTRATWWKVSTSVDWVHLSRTRDNVEPSCDERLHDPRADPLRRSGHDGCLRWVAHICLPRKRLVTEGAGSVSLDFDCFGVGYT